MIKFYSFVFFLFCGILSHADVDVSSSVDRNKMGKNDSFTFSITISSKSSVSAQEPQLPVLESFDIINTWTGVESRSNFINGQFQVERKQTFNYMLAPQKEGKFKIGSANIEIDGKTYNTKPIDIEVVAGDSLPPPPTQNQQSLFDDEDDIFSQFLQRRPRPGFRSQPIDPNDSFFIQVEVDKTEVYAGEQLTATFYLYSRAQITDIDTLNYPSLNGFWKEDIEVATRLGFKDEIVNGIVYRRALLASYALFPIKPGVAKIDPYKARCSVLTSGALGFGRPVQLTKESKEVEIKVKALPPTDTDIPFVGGVGEFTVSSSLDSREIPMNQPLTWKIVFSGSGNAKLIDLPKFELPEGLELYSSKNEAKFQVNGASSKEFELLVIPRKPGSYSLPQFTMKLFNPNTSKYYTVNTQPETINVQAGKGDETISSIPLAENKEPEKSKSYEPQIILSWQASPFVLSQFQIFSLWGALYFLVTIFLIWRGFKELRFGQRKKDIEAILRSKFKKVYESRDKQDWRAVGVEVMNTFYFLLGEISGQGGASQEIEKLMLKVPPSVRREVGENLLKSLKKFEILSFAPEAAVGTLKSKEELKKNITEMEKLLLKAVSLGLGTQLNA